jgi:hypothetical protein
MIYRPRAFKQSHGIRAISAPWILRGTAAAALLFGWSYAAIGDPAFSGPSIPSYGGWVNDPPAAAAMTVGNDDLYPWEEVIRPESSLGMSALPYSGWQVEPSSAGTTKSPDLLRHRQ